MDQKLDGFSRLQANALFAALSPADIHTLARHVQPRSLEVGDLLFKQEDRARHFYFVLSGCIKLFRLSPKGTEKIVELVYPDQTFAEAVMFMEHQSYPVFAAALEPTEVLAIDSAAYRAALHENPEACFRLLADLSKRLRGKLGEIDALSLQNARFRVAHYLLEQAEMCHGNVFQLDAQKKVLASRLSLQPETLSRTLAELKSAKVIALDGSRVEILDRAGLRSLVLDSR